MLHVALFQPEIPPNTGNIIRLCANTGANLHLIEPLGFSLNDARARRAGLDYWELARVTTHASLADFLRRVQPARLFACSTRGRRTYADVSFSPNDAVIFGPETRGLPAEILAEIPQNNVLRLPMVSGSRSLNLSNAVAVVVYEAWRQHCFRGALTAPDGH